MAAKVPTKSEVVERVTCPICTKRAVVRKSGKMANHPVSSSPGAPACRGGGQTVDEAGARTATAISESLAKLAAHGHNQTPADTAAAIADGAPFTVVPAPGTPAGVEAKLVDTDQVLDGTVAKPAPATEKPITIIDLQTGQPIGRGNVVTLPTSKRTPGPRPARPAASKAPAKPAPARSGGLNLKKMDDLLSLATRLDGASRIELNAWFAAATDRMANAHGTSAASLKIQARLQDLISELDKRLNKTASQV